jgi:glycosyltransferase involved in cell wall biosynthesis
MEVTVIIPVYNSENYIKSAVESAISQIQTKEIILIDDGSTDNSFKKCIELQKKYGIIKILQHPSNSNLGPAKSRNLGIDNSSCEYIAFLDSDDFYLPFFFNEVEKRFAIDENLDAVFGTIGSHYYDKSAKLKHLNRLGSEITGINANYSYKKNGNLFDFLQLPGSGHFSIISLVVKKRILKEIGFFDEDLIQSEDTDLIWRLSLLGKLESIEFNKVIALRGVHNYNSVFNFKQYYYYQYHLLKKWVDLITKLNISKKSSRILIQKYLTHFKIIKYFDQIFFLRIMIKVIILSFLIIKNPKLIFHFMK